MARTMTSSHFPTLHIIPLARTLGSTILSPEWEAEKKDLEAKGLRKTDFEVTEPYSADVSEGKSNSIYMAHSYHTKVPHPAIMRYLLHYTQPGDIVLDGFCGTGMTGVAANLCGSKSEVDGLKLSQASQVADILSALICRLLHLL